MDVFRGLWLPLQGRPVGPPDESRGEARLGELVMQLLKSGALAQGMLLHYVHARLLRKLA